MQIQITLIEVPTSVSDHIIAFHLRLRDAPSASLPHYKITGRNILNYLFPPYFLYNSTDETWNTRQRTYRSDSRYSICITKNYQNQILKIETAAHHMTHRPTQFQIVFDAAKAWSLMFILLRGTVYGHRHMSLLVITLFATNIRYNALRILVFEIY